MCEKDRRIGGNLTQKSQWFLNCLLDEVTWIKKVITILELRIQCYLTGFSVYYSWRCGKVSSFFLNHPNNRNFTTSCPFKIFDDIFCQISTAFQSLKINNDYQKSTEMLGEYLTELQLQSDKACKVHFIAQQQQEVEDIL